MAVSTDIFRSWRQPRAVVGGILAQGTREDRAIGLLMSACLLIFVAQWPRLARKAQGFDLAPDAEIPDLTQLVAYEMLSWMVIWPLMFYAIAGLSHLVARLFGGQGTHFGARIALFWALLAAAPLLLLHGLTMGFIGAGPSANLVGVVWVGVFLWIWSQGLFVAERGARDDS